MREVVKQIGVIGEVVKQRARVCLAPIARLAQSLSGGGVRSGALLLEPGVDPLGVGDRKLARDQIPAPHLDDLIRVYMG